MTSEKNYGLEPSQVALSLALMEKVNASSIAGMVVMTPDGEKHIIYSTVDDGSDEITTIELGSRSRLSDVIIDPTDPGNAMRIIESLGVEWTAHKAFSDTSYDYKVKLFFAAQDGRTITSSGVGTSLCEAVIEAVIKMDYAQ